MVVHGRFILSVIMKIESGWCRRGRSIISASTCSTKGIFPTKTYVACQGVAGGRYDLRGECQRQGAGANLYADAASRLRS